MRSTAKRFVSKRTSRRGATLVEFAIVFPIAFLLFFGMVEITRVLLLQHSVDTAAYEGARSGMVPGATAQDAATAAHALCTAAGLKSCDVQISPEVLSEETAIVTVRVEVPMANNAWAGPIFFSKRSIVSEVTLMCERPPMVQLTGVPQLKGKASSLKSALNGVQSTVNGAL